MLIRSVKQHPPQITRGHKSTFFPQCRLDMLTYDPRPARYRRCPAATNWSSFEIIRHQENKLSLFYQDLDQQRLIFNSRWASTVIFNFLCPSKISNSLIFFSFEMSPKCVLVLSISPGFAQNANVAPYRVGGEGRPFVEIRDIEGDTNTRCYKYQKWK